MASSYKARTVMGVIATKWPDGTVTTKEIGAVEAIRKGEAMRGPVLTFGGVMIGPDPGIGFIGKPPAEMLANDFALVTCPCGKPWPGSTQDRLSARAPEKAPPRKDGRERVGPGYVARQEQLGHWPTPECQRAQDQLAFKLEHPGELAVAAARAKGETDPVELERVRAIAVAKATSARGGRGAGTAAVFAAAQAEVDAAAQAAKPTKPAKTAAA